MIVKRTKIIEKEETIYTCDFCGFNSNDDVGWCSVKPVMECEVCKRHFCKECGKLYYFVSDYPEFKYCKSCNEVYMEFLPHIEALEEEYGDKKEELQKKWLKIALDKAK